MSNAVIRKMIDERWHELDVLHAKKESWEQSGSIIMGEMVKELSLKCKKVEKEINKLYKKLKP